MGQTNQMDRTARTDRTGRVGRMDLACPPPPVSQVHLVSPIIHENKTMYPEHEDLFSLVIREALESLQFLG